MSQLPQFYLTLHVGASSYGPLGGFVSTGSTKTNVTFSLPDEFLNGSCIIGTLGDFSLHLVSTKSPPNSVSPSSDTAVGYEISCLNGTASWLSKGTAPLPSGGSVTVRHDAP